MKVLSDSLRLFEKKILRREYRIATTVELEEGFQKMCNLSELIEEKAELRLLLALVQEEGYPIERAAERVGVSITEFESLLEQKKVGKVIQ